MGQKVITVLRLCLAAALAAVLASSHAAGAGSLRFVTIGTGGASSTYRAVGEAICELLAEETGRDRSPESASAKPKPFAPSFSLPSKDNGEDAFRCSAPSTGGSTYNIKQLAKRAFNFGLTQSDWQYHAFNGTAQHLVRRYTGLRAVFSIHSEPFHVVVRKDSGIRRFEDLKGKRVNIGNPGSGQRGTMEVLMKVYGMDMEDFSKATELTSVEQAGALCNNRIDAFTITANAPDPNIALATNRCGARILPMDSAIERKLVAEQPYYAFFTLPKGTYKTMDEDVTTFGVRATLVTRSTASEKTVHALVRAVMENIDTFRNKNPALRVLDPQKMITEGLSAPLHPGALRYYKEKGWK